MKEIKKIEPMSLAKITALIYLFFGIVLAVFGYFVGMYATAAPSELFVKYGAVILFVMPMAYLIGGFVFGYIVALIYNALASKMGGVKVDLK